MNDTDHEKLAYTVRQALTASVNRLDAQTAEKLVAARRNALGRFQEGQRASGKFGRAIAIASSFPLLRTGLLVLALTVGITGSYYWHQFRLAEEHEEIDSILLADDLPPAAYIDRGFQQWQARASNSSSQ